jgi:ribosomal protein S6
MADDSQAVSASTQANDSLPVYEIGYHVVPTVGDEGVSKVVEAIRKALGDAEIISEGFPQKTPLAYVVERARTGKHEKYTESYFGFIKFAVEREAFVAFKEKVATVPEILRHIVIETVREDLMQQKQRTVFASDRLEGKTLEKPTAAPEKAAEVSQEELDKSLEALTG